MDNAQKAIMIGVGLFITIIIISVVLLITNLGTGIANQGTEQLSGISSELMDQLIQRFDGRTVSGVDAKSAATNTLYDDVTFEFKDSANNTIDLADVNASIFYTGSVSEAASDGNVTVTFTVK